MSMWLRQSTAGQEILLGPFLDSGDGNTIEDALTINNTDIKLWKEGATTEANKNSGGATHIAGGRYYAVLDATDSNTLGKLEVNVHVSGALAVRREYMVLPANVYDSLVLGTDTLQADTVQWLGTAVTLSTTTSKPEVDVNSISDDSTAADNMELDYDGSGYNKSASTIGACTLLTGHTPQTGDSYPVVTNATYGLDKLVRSTTPANTLDVNATGEAGIDLDNTSGTLAKGTDLTGFNDIAAGDVWAVDATTQQTQGTFGQAIGDPGVDVDTIWGLANSYLDATISSRQPSGAVDLNADQSGVTIGAVSGAVGSVTGAVGSVTGNVGGNVTGNVTGSVGSLAAQAKTDVNTEVVDVITVDTLSENAQGIPPATPTVKELLMYLFMTWRNKLDVTAALKEVHNDAGTVICKKSLSDDGTTYIETEMVSGP